MSSGPYNAAVDVLERNDSPGRSQRNYIITSEGTWTYGDVIASVRIAANGLQGLGLMPGDRVVISLGDRPEFVVAFWAALRAGLVAVLAPPTLAARELRAVCVASSATAILYDGPSRASALAVIEASARAGMNPLTGIVTGGPVPNDQFLWADLCTGDSGAQGPEAPTFEHDAAFLLCTSGTSGEPKLVTHTHGDLRYAPDFLDRQVVKLHPADVALSVSKMSFSYGLANSLYTTAAAGAAVALTAGPAIPALVQDSLRMSAVSVLYGVPNFWRALLVDSVTSIPDTVRMAFSGGELLDADLHDHIRRRFGLTVLDTYGMSETLQSITSNLPDDVVPGSCGRVLDGFEVRVVNRAGRDVADGRRGELWVSGRTVSAGYWNRPDLTAQAFQGRWFRTGDLVRVQDGHVFHLGRLDDLVKIGGRWVAPAEIEGILRRHPDVRDVAVSGRSHPSGLTSLCGYVVTDREDDQLTEELTKLCGHLSPHKIPREWERCLDLPRTKTGKLRRVDLGVPAGR